MTLKIERPNGREVYGIWQNELFPKAFAAHGGLDRGNSFETVQATIVTGGQLLEMKGAPQDPTPRRMRCPPSANRPRLPRMAQMTSVPTSQPAGSPLRKWTGRLSKSGSILRSTQRARLWMLLGVFSIEPT